MNHDYAHCIDFTKDCPKDCFRAQLVRDLKPGLIVSFMSLKDTDECMKNKISTTTESAIDQLENTILLIKQDGKDWMDERDIPVLEMAIDALKKQVPTKATGEHYAHMRCPSCNHRIPSGGGSSSKRRDNWCNYCGQKIDWSK